MRLRTGFEQASLRNILTAWLYSGDNVEVLRAAVEMRKRFEEIFPRSEKTETIAPIKDV